MEKGLLPLQITGAKVRRITLQYEEKILKFSAEVGLVMQNGDILTSLYIGNDSWDDKKNAELTLLTIELANQLRDEIAISVTRQLNKIQNVLDVKKKN